MLLYELVAMICIPVAVIYATRALVSGPLVFLPIGTPRLSHAVLREGSYGQMSKSRKLSIVTVGLCHCSVIGRRQT